MQFLTQLLISQFRTLQNATISFTPSIHTIIGPNNTGKTSLLMAIKLTLAILHIWAEIQTNDYNLEDSEDYINKSIGASLQSLFHNTKGILLTATLGNDSKSQISITLHRNKVCEIACDNSHEARGFILRSSMCYFHSVFPPTDEESEVNLYDNPIRWYDVTRLTLKIRNVYRFLCEPKQRRHEIGKESQFEKEVVRRKQVKEHILSDLQFFFYEIVDLIVLSWNHQPITLKVRRKHELDVDPDKLLDISAFGAGQLNIMYMVLNLHYQRYVSQAKNIVYLLDEPTAFLHENLVPTTVEFLKSQNDCQFIVATNSSSFHSQVQDQNNV